MNILSHLDYFQIYLIIINVLAFMLLFVDFLQYIYGKNQVIPQYVFLIVLLLGGSLGSTIAYVVLDRKPYYGEYGKEAKKLRDSILNWRISTFLLLVVHILIYLYAYGYLKIGNMAMESFDILAAINYLYLKIGIVGFYLIIINVISFVVYAVDKYKAKKGKYRISILCLFIVALLGGSLGALLSMFIFKHKTNKMYFRIGIPLIFLIHILLLVSII